MGGTEAGNKGSSEPKGAHRHLITNKLKESKTNTLPHAWKRLGHQDSRHFN